MRCHSQDGWEDTLYHSFATCGQCGGQEKLENNQRVSDGGRCIVIVIAVGVGRVIRPSCYRVT